jgi:hypothetical protein
MRKVLIVYYMQNTEVENWQMVYRERKKTHHFNPIISLHIHINKKYLNKTITYI